MVFHILLGLVGHPPLPINIVYTLDDARQPALPYIPSSSSSQHTSNPKVQFSKILYKFLKHALHTHSYKITTLILLTGIIKYHYQLKTRTILGIYILLLYAVYKRQLYLIKKWSNNYTSHQYQSYPNLKNDSIYHSQSLIQQSYHQPVGQYYKPLLIYQPISGYCGYATLNTVITSITIQRYHQQHPNTNSNERSADIALSKGILQCNEPNYIAVDVMCRLLDRLKEKNLWDYFGIEGYDDLSGISYEELSIYIEFA